MVQLCLLMLFMTKEDILASKKSRQMNPSCTNTRPPGHRTIFVALQSLAALTNHASFEKGKLC